MVGPLQAHYNWRDFIQPFSFLLFLVYFTEISSTILQYANVYHHISDVKCSRCKTNSEGEILLRLHRANICLPIHVYFILVPPLSSLFLIPTINSPLLTHSPKTAASPDSYRLVALLKNLLVRLYGLPQSAANFLRSFRQYRSPAVLSAMSGFGSLTRSSLAASRKKRVGIVILVAVCESARTNTTTLRSQ